MRVYSDEEIMHHLSASAAGWTYADGVIRQDFGFEDFKEAFSFMTAVALEAENLDHHPDWSNVYNKVTIALNTHSAGGITRLDFDLALRIDRVFAKFQS